MDYHRLRSIYLYVHVLLCMSMPFKCLMRVLQLPDKPELITENILKLNSLCPNP